MPGRPGGTFQLSITNPTGSSPSYTARHQGSASGICTASFSELGTDPTNRCCDGRTFNARTASRFSSVISTSRTSISPTLVEQVIQLRGHDRTGGGAGLLPGDDDEDQALQQGDEAAGGEVGVDVGAGEADLAGDHVPQVGLAGAELGEALGPELEATHEHGGGLGLVRAIPGDQLHHHRGDEPTRGAGLGQGGDDLADLGPHVLDDDLQREQQHLVLAAEVVLHQAHRHAGLGGDAAQGDGLPAVAAGDPPQRLGDLPPPRLMVHDLRHRFTIRCIAKTVTMQCMVKTTTNGDVVLAYETFGVEGTPILLLTGAAAQMVMWPTAFCEALAGKGFHVVRMDNRGTGLSQDPTTTQFTLDDIA